MKHILLFESFDLRSHLLDRGVDPDKTQLIIDEENNDVYFFLYNLSGQMIGFQKYNPLNSKKGREREGKYYSYMTDEGSGKSLGVWGLHSYDWQDEFIFITEGIFDAARIQQTGYPAIALLSNDPSKGMKSWLKTLPQKKIVIYDNDSAGKKLMKVGDFAYTVPTGKDMNDLNPTEAKQFIEECLRNSGF